MWLRECESEKVRDGKEGQEQVRPVLKLNSEWVSEVWQGKKWEDNRVQEKKRWTRHKKMMKKGRGDEK